MEARSSYQKEKYILILHDNLGRDPFFFIRTFLNSIIHSKIKSENFEKYDIYA